MFHIYLQFVFSLNFIRLQNALVLITKFTLPCGTLFYRKLRWYLPAQFCFPGLPNSVDNTYILIKLTRGRIKDQGQRRQKLGLFSPQEFRYLSFTFTYKNYVHLIKLCSGIQYDVEMVFVKTQYCFTCFLKVLKN